MRVDPARLRLVDASIRRPVTVFITALAAIVFGFVALDRLPTDLLPELSYPSITVRTEYDGAAPVEVESLVTRPVENAVGVVDGVERVTSSSRADISEVTIEMAWGTNMDLAALEVRERLDVVQLPVDAERPVLLRYDPSLDPVLRLALTGGPSADLVRLRRLAEEEVERRLERIEGVAAAVVSGGLEEELLVLVDERRIANLGVSVDRLVSRLAEENVDLTGGRLELGQSEYVVRAVGELVRPEDLEAVVVDADRGALVRLGDVARVVRGHRDREVVTRVGGRESVEIAIYKEGGTNTVAVSRAVQSELETLGRRLSTLDPGLGISIVTDQARYIQRAVSEVVATAFYGGLLAVLVLYLFLREVASTAIIAAAIPVSVVATFFLMYASGVSLNVMSLGGLTLGLGLLVDNAIVVLEAIHRRRELGADPLEAASVGTAEVGRAVVASTLTTICVFVPVVFVEGVAGQLFGDQALTVTFALSVSLAVALTLIPMLASRQLPTTHGSDPSRTGWLHRGLVAFGRLVMVLVRAGGRGLGLLLSPAVAAFHGGLGVVASTYERLLARVLARPGWTVVVAVLLLAGSLALVPGLGFELVPELAQGELVVAIELPPGTHLSVTERRVERLETRIGALEDVRQVASIVGASSERGGVAGERREHIAELDVSLAAGLGREGEERVVGEIREILDAEPNLVSQVGRPSYFTLDDPVEIEIRGYDLALLEALGDDLLERLRGVDGLTDVSSSTEGGLPELRIRFDRARLAALGIDAGTVSATLRAKIQGQVATAVERSDREIEVRVRADEQYRDEVGDLGGLVVHQMGKTAIRLASVATIEEGEGPAEIRRLEGDRVAVVTAGLDGRDLGSAAAEIEGILAGFDLPAGFDWSLGGQRQEMASSFSSLRLALFLAIFMVYLVMASQFESLVHPLVILVSVPFSAVGVLVTLAVLRIPVSVVVLIGAILLAGIVVNNAILLVDTANRRRRDGEPRLEALAQAGAIRLRPILMTTATTVLGLAPMAVGLGEGSELRSPMAWTVIGGLLASTALTLLVVPAVYALVDRRGGGEVRPEHGVSS